MKTLIEIDYEKGTIHFDGGIKKIPRASTRPFEWIGSVFGVFIISTSILYGIFHYWWDFDFHFAPFFSLIFGLVTTILWAVMNKFREEQNARA